MADRVARLAERILAINWEGDLEKMYSRGALMLEYLRRAAWWKQATGARGWPFFDIAAAVNPEVRADPAVVDRVTARLHSNYQGGWVERTCVFALHFAALQDAGVPLPEAPAEPFEPLVKLMERGGSFRTEGSGLIDVDLLGIPIRTPGEYLRAEPYVELDEAVLDEIDRRKGLK